MLSSYFLDSYAIQDSFFLLVKFIYSLEEDSLTTFALGALVWCLEGDMLWILAQLLKLCFLNDCFWKANF